jgi:hypothetical protein
MRKSNLKTYQTVVAGDMSANITSPVTNILFLDNIGIQLNFSGSPVGNFEIQTSIDYAQDDFGNVTNAGTWIPIELFFNGDFASDIPTDVLSPIVINLNQLSFPWIRIVYLATSGSGTLDAFVSAKMV